MDCEKYEPLLLDELYDELDELTSAAVKRHVSGCARCASILNGLRGTREAVALPLVSVPEGLEDKILAAAREAQKVVPIRSRFSRALSIAGGWAMRPQTAMAAVFLLMIGTSAFLVRSTGAPRSSAMSVTVEGAPAPMAAAPAAESDSLDDKAAASAHGPTPPVVMRAPPAATATVALADPDSPADDVAGKAKKDEANQALALAEPAAPGANAYAPPPAAPRPATRAADRDDPWGSAERAAPASAARSASGPATPQDAASLGQAAFRARNYAEATRQYDIAARSGDTQSALWAAEAVREGQGCGAALGRFDQLSRTAAGSYVGNQAALSAARCEMNMGQTDSARGRLEKLAQTSTHQQQANQALAELNQQVAARKAAGSTRAGGAVAAPKAAAPAPAPMKSEQRSHPTNAEGY